LAVVCANANTVLMQAVQQNVFLILNRVPVTFVTDPELIWPSIPVMTHSLDQKVMANSTLWTSTLWIPAVFPATP